MLDFLTAPSFPKAAIGFERGAVTALALRKESGGFAVSQAASVELPDTLLASGFLDRNIASVKELRVFIEEAITSAGLLNQKKWSASLPGNTARSAIITMETAAAGKGEAEEIVDWKTEQAFGISINEMRVSRVKIAADSQNRTRYFATAVKLSVLDEYESVFEGFGWDVGLVLPRAVSESKWLAKDSKTTDSILISLQADGFTAVLLRDGEPNVVRTVTCTVSERDDEIYRLLMFYSDRFGGDSGTRALDRLLVVGPDLLPAKIKEISTEALGRAIRILTPAEIGFSYPEGSFRFEDLAAPAGLASFGA